MRRYLILAVLGALLISVIPSAADGTKVLMIVKHDKEESADLELMLTKEVGVMTDLLERAGFEVEVASVSGKPLATEKTTLEPDLKLEDVRVADYAGFIMPCLAVGFEVPLYPEVAAVVKEAVSEGKPVAAQVDSIITLARAGLLSGKKYSFPEEWAPAQSVLKDAIHSGHGIVQDGKIITSGACPFAARRFGFEDGTSKLTQALIAEMGRD